MWYTSQMSTDESSSGRTEGQCPSCGGAISADAASCARCLSALAVPASQPVVQVEDERRHLTIVFCDLVSYSALSEQLELEEQTDVVREYRRIGTEITSRFGGFMAQFLGDGLLSYFGYPLSHEDCAQRAVLASLEMQRALEQLAAQWRERGVQLAARIGIHAGIALIGREQLAVGPAVNCAARVQALARPGSVLVTGSIHRIARGYFEYLDRGSHTLKGFAQPFNLYEVLGESGARHRLEAHVPYGLAPFVDREVERGLMLDFWKRASGAMSSVLLIGEPGIGKSRTLLEFRAQIAADRPKLLEARCSELHQSSALFPLLELMRAELAWTISSSVQDIHARLLAQIEPASDADAKADLLGALLAAAPQSTAGKPSVAAKVLRQRMLEAVADWIALHVREQRVLFVLEDLHWADPSTLEAISTLLSRSATPNLMVVISARSDIPLEWTRGKPHHTLRLDRLPREHAQRLVSELSSAARLPDSTADRILDNADGIPLFVEEITLGMIEAPAEVDGGATPLTLRDSLQARLDRLGALKHVAQQVAVLGREFSIDLWREAYAVPEPKAERMLQQLERLGVLVRREDREPGRFEFRHALIHNEAYHSLARTSLRECHARAADALLRAYPERALREPELLAYHFAKAGRHAEAAAAYARAGHQAITRSAFAEAVSVFKAALVTLGHVPHSEARDVLEIDVRAGLGIALVSIRGFTVPEVEEVYRRGVELSERISVPPLRVLYGLWNYHVVRGDHFGAARVLPLMQRAQANAQTDCERIVTSTGLGTYAFFRNDFVRAEEEFVRAHALVDERDVATQMTELMSNYGFEGMLCPALFLAWIRLYQGHTRECRERLTRALQLARESKHPYLLSQALGIGIPLAHDLHDKNLALSISDELLVLAQENGFAYWVASALCGKGLAMFQAGHLQPGSGLIDQGLSTLKAMGAYGVYTYFLTYRIRSLISQGDADAAEEALDLAYGFADTGLNANVILGLAAFRGAIAVLRGDHMEGIRQMQAVLASPGTLALPLFGLRTAVWLADAHRLHGRARDTAVLTALDAWIARVAECDELDDARTLRSSLR